MRVLLEEADFDEVRGVMEGVIDFVPTDEEIMAVVRGDGYMVGVALEFGWNETEVRDRMATALERRRSGDNG